MYDHWIEFDVMCGHYECRACRQVVRWRPPASRVAGKNLHCVAADVPRNLRCFNGSRVGRHMTANAPAGKRISKRKLRSRGKSRQSRLCLSVALQDFFSITLHKGPFKPLTKAAL